MISGSTYCKWSNLIVGSHVLANHPPLHRALMVMVVMSSLGSSVTANHENSFHKSNAFCKSFSLRIHDVNKKKNSRKNLLTSSTCWKWTLCRSLFVLSSSSPARNPVARQDCKRHKRYNNYILVHHCTVSFCVHRQQHAQPKKFEEMKKKEKKQQMKKTQN